MNQECVGLFLAEGSSDEPLADLVTVLFAVRGVDVRVRAPDLTRLEKVGKDVSRQLRAGLRLVGEAVDVVIVHRDVDGFGHAKRREQVQMAAHEAGCTAELVPVLTIRMTEARLLLDVAAIRRVAGNPKGSVPLSLPKLAEVERLADPKQALRAAFLAAADVTGRRKAMVDKRFSNNRRLLLQQLDPFGPVQQLSAWQAMLADIDATVQRLAG